MFTGSQALNPVNGERVPVFVADYVLMTYGTGAIMGVPAHDARDFDFARTLGAEIRTVIAPPEGGGTPLQQAFEGEGRLVNSGEFNGLSSAEAGRRITGWLKSRGVDTASVTFGLRDWLISRQRYWGPPIPIIYCDKCGVVPVPEEDLPVLLPDLEDYHPTGTGVSPLATVPEFVHVKCPNCGGAARRETDVSDNFLDSAWYFLRYPSSNDAGRAWDPNLTRLWLPVDMYVGGPEHSVLHLLYTRFLCMALRDLGLLEFDEPFKKFRAHGLITYDGAKMSKSRGNVVNPDEYIDQFGADVLRLYLMFIGPFDQGGDFSDRSIIGVSRFLQRVTTLIERFGSTVPGESTLEPVDDSAQRILHRTIKQVTTDLGALRYNTAVAALMSYGNALSKRDRLARREVEALILMLAPFAPHFAEEMWERIGGAFSVHGALWPEFNEGWTKGEKLLVPLQVNGRRRGFIEVEEDVSEEEVIRLALASEYIQKHVVGKDVKRVVYIPGRILNVVV